MAHFQMSTGGSKSNEHVDHFLVDIHILKRVTKHYTVVIKAKENI